MEKDIIIIEGKQYYTSTASKEATRLIADIKIIDDVIVMKENEIKKLQLEQDLIKISVATFIDELKQYTSELRAVEDETETSPE